MYIWIEYIQTYATIAAKTLNINGTNHQNQSNLELGTVHTKKTKLHNKFCNKYY